MHETVMAITEVDIKRKSVQERGRRLENEGRELEREKEGEGGRGGKQK